jgi:hypothetical protein
MSLKDNANPGKRGREDKKEGIFCTGYNYSTRIQLAKNFNVWGRLLCSGNVQRRRGGTYG